jgi:hypothetical protein
MSTAANIHLSITETNGRTTQMVWNVRHDGYPAAILEKLKKVVGFADNRDDGEVDDIGDGAYPFPDELSYSYLVKREKDGTWSLWMGQGIIDDTFLVGPIGF